MFTKSFDLYDALYAFKDYEGASEGIREFARARHDGARTLLDVACGTGRHLEHLRRHFDVAGLDLNPELLRIAADRLPGVPLHRGDMAAFDLGRRFDVVTCLFSSIAYVRTAERMRQAVARMAAHLEPGGLLLVEPWFTPETYWSDTITANHVDEPDRKVAWMYVSVRRDLLSVLDIHFMVGTPGGIDRFNEVHEMGLFTHEEYVGAMEDAGLRVEHDPRGFMGRGLYVGTAPDAD